jgi:excisionase family DNA binding protein
MATRSYSVPQAACELGVSAKAVYQAIREKRLPAQRRGGRWFIRPEDLGAYRARRDATLHLRGLDREVREVVVKADGERARRLYIRRPGRRHWRRHAELPPGEEVRVEVPVGFELGISDRTAATVPDLPGAVEPMEA